LPRPADDDCHGASVSALEATACERREQAACRHRVRVPYVELGASDAIALTAHGGVDASVPGLGGRVAGGEHAVLYGRDVEREDRGVLGLVANVTWRLFCIQLASV
jgi:hypothetical protein